MLEMKTKQKISYRELCDKYLGGVVLANEVFETLLKSNDYNFDVENGSFYEYFNQYGHEITAEQFEENIFYGFDAIEQEIEFFQYFLIDKATAGTLCDLTDETVIYFPNEDAYFWCVDHWGTAWDYSYTEIELTDYLNDDSKAL